MSKLEKQKNLEKMVEKKIRRRECGKEYTIIKAKES